MKKKIDPIKGSGIQVDSALDKYTQKVLFPEKVEAMNKLLAKSPIPKWIFK